jgi:hypothetical protein
MEASVASPTTIYLSPKQRQGLFRLARKRKTNFSKELRSAVDFYLQLPPDVDLKDLEALAREAHASLDRSNARLDDAVARVKLTVKRLNAIDERLHELAQERL